ncbi:DNase [Enterobacter cloacae]|uniref:DNase n=1 Tax=Enterobacter cloacae TaxID=550 RepID=A0A4Q2E8E3_ENTCL|nr:DNase [Enterobacter cloacae]
MNDIDSHQRRGGMVGCQRRSCWTPRPLSHTEKIPLWRVLTC